MTDRAGPRLISESVAYAAIEAGQNLLALIVVPFSLFWLTPLDMGVVTLAILASQVVLVVGTLGLDFALIRYYFRWTDAQRPGRAKGILVAVLAWALLLTMAAAWAWNVWRDQPWAAMAFMAASAGTGLAVRAIPMALLRVTSGLRRYAAVAVFGSVTQAVTQIGLLAAGAGPVGYLAGVSISAWLSALLASGLMLRDVTANGIGLPDGQFLRFAAIGAGSSLFNRLVSGADRLALSAWSTLDALGVYGTAARWSTPLRMVSGATKLALSPELSREEGRAGVSEAAARATAPFVTLLALLAAVLQLSSWCILFTPWRTVLSDFQPLLSILLMAQLLGALTFIDQVVLFYLDRPTRSTLLSALNAILTVTGLVWLVPRHGATGAAAVQLAANAATLIILGAVTASLPWRSLRVGRVVLVSAVCTLAACLAAPIVSGIVTLAGGAVLASWTWHDLEVARRIEQWRLWGRPAR